MKKTKVLASALSITLLTNAILPATKLVDNINTPLSSIAYAAEEKTPQKEAEEKINYLQEIISSLENISGGLAGNQLSWLKELKHAAEFLGKIVNKGIGSAAELRNKIIPRVDLLINVAETITADATELADSEQQAHVIIGFSVTRALLKATDLFEGAEGLNKASENLSASLDKAREVPKLTDDSKRTHYTLEKLDRAIAKAKEIRNKELKNKLDPSKLADIDLLIRQAQDVRRDGRATVCEVNAMAAELNEKIDEAYKAIPEGERTANKAQKRDLEKDIQAAKNLRDFTLKGKADSSVIKQLNREIADANRVLKNNNATISQVESADEMIVEAMNKALASVKEEKPAEPVEEETAPEVEENTPVEEEVTEDESEEETETEEASEVEETSEEEAETEETDEKSNEEEAPVEEETTEESEVIEG